MTFRQSIVRWVISFACAIALPLGSQQAALGANQPASEARTIFAENLAQLAQITLAGRAITPETLRQSIVFLKGALRLNPDESRFARLLAEAALQAGDTEAAIQAYNVLRRLDPNDRFAQIRLIDLVSTTLQTSDARLSYLKKLIDSDKYAAEVRSHAALLACNIHFERAQTQEAMKRLEDALGLNPLNPQALKLKYELQGDSGSSRDRVALLLQMLRSNPVQPGVMTRLGAEIAGVGMHEEAMAWYRNGITWSNAVGRGAHPEDYTGLLALMVITNQPGGMAIVKQLLEADATNVDAALIALLIAKRSGDEQLLSTSREAAEKALLTQASRLHRTISGTDQSAESTPEEPAEPDSPTDVDVPADIRRLLELNDPRLTTQYASVLADLAWVRVYFNENPTGAEEVLAQLRQLLPGDSVTGARLEGWIYLLAGRAGEARVKLSAVADRDPLAQLGMIRLLEQDPAMRDRVTEDARKLMDQNPSGVLGAIIHDALREKKPRLDPGQKPPLSEAAAAVQAEIDAFPKDWLDFLSDPSKFYMLRVEPLKVTHRYGEPIVARIIVENISKKYDITVGPDGAIRPDIWFNVHLKGINPGGFEGVAFDRLGQHVLLKPGMRIVQTVRIDQSQLVMVLQQDAAIAWPLFFMAYSNPIPTQGHVIAGPGGQRVSFTRVVNRTGVPYNDQTLQKMLAQVGSGTPTEKIYAGDLLLWLYSRMSAVQDENMQARASMIPLALMRAANDPDPQVRSMMNLIAGRVVPLDQLRTILTDMFRDNAWESRLLGLFLVQRLDVSDWKPVAGPLAENDPDPLVREFAATIVDFADNPAATQPAKPVEGSPDAGGEPE